MVEMELSLIFNYVDNETMSLLSNDETCLTLLRALFLLLLLTVEKWDNNYKKKVPFLVLLHMRNMLE